MDGAGRSESPYKEVVKLSEDLMDLAMGPRGADIEQARAVPGVFAVTVDKEKCTFRIFGQNPEAVRQARMHLEFREEYFQVPSRFVEEVSGENGKNLQDIKNISGVLQITVNERCNGKFYKVKDMVPFGFMGTPKTIAVALTLLDDLLSTLQYEEEMNQEDFDRWDDEDHSCQNLGFVSLADQS